MPQMLYDFPVRLQKYQYKNVYKYFETFFELNDAKRFLEKLIISGQITCDNRWWLTWNAALSVIYKNSRSCLVVRRADFVTQKPSVKMTTFSGQWFSAWNLKTTSKSDQPRISEACIILNLHFLTRRYVRRRFAIGGFYSHVEVHKLYSQFGHHYQV